MKDIKLDFLNKVVIDEYIDKKDRVLQQIRLAINTWLEDWGLDETFGIDYDNSWQNQSLMEFYIRKMILQVEGISQINTFTINKELDNNNYLTYFIKTEVVFEGEVLIVDERVDI